MNKVFIVLAFFLGISSMGAQELNCEVIVNAEQTGQTNLQVLKLWNARFRN